MIAVDFRCPYCKEESACQVDDDEINEKIVVTCGECLKDFVLFIRLKPKTYKILFNNGDIE